MKNAAGIMVSQWLDPFLSNVLNKLTLCRALNVTLFLQDVTQTHDKARTSCFEFYLRGEADSVFSF